MFSVLLEELPDGGGRYLDWLLSGLGWTVFLALASWAIAFALGVAVGCGRTARSRPIALLARLYVEVFRNVPVIVQMFVWYFVVPELLPRAWGQAIKEIPPPWGSVIPALLGLALYTAARVAEQVKAGLEALPRGQRMAADALGMRGLQAYRLVLLPQALRIIVPTLTSEVMGVFKNSSVALTIGVLELTAQARQINEFTFQTFQAFGAATLAYLGLALMVYALMRLIERRLRIPGNEPAPAVRSRGRAGKSLKEV
ncbi:amino acid ABC transporter permease [Achromobacter sp. Marseille-Q0513]|uniref:amino acid ABC transporter permease n=1 Tax=Achromobacter sp. Marseille-Q0513 TaxID=2829161 RepID=UPI001B9E1B51|nr:amino acid ABC transporter permease [Achromobacter sp. Marseille-Q0513]MBR8653660.1 amino acid ABC transporter permease [Achromobacter sp. Marseille-Q0513]